MIVSIIIYTLFYPSCLKAEEDVRLRQVVKKQIES